MHYVHGRAWVWLAVLCQAGCHLAFPYDPEPDAGVDQTVDRSGRDLTADLGDLPVDRPREAVLPDDLPLPPDLWPDVSPDAPQPPPDIAPPPDITPDLPAPDIKLDLPPTADSGITAPGVTWVKRIYSTKSDFPLAMAQGSKGDLYLVGYFTGPTLMVDKKSMPSTAPNASSGFVVKIASNGSPQWIRGLNNDKMAIVNDVAVDSQDNVYITGHFKGSLTIGTTKLTAQSDDIVVAKLDSSGGYLWAKAFGGVSSDMGLNIALDSASNVYVACTFQKTLALSKQTHTSKGGRDLLLVSYTSKGNYRWAERAGGSNHDDPGALAVGGNGQLYLGGNYLNSTNLGGAPLVSQGTMDMYVASFKASDGGHRWSTSFGGLGADTITGLTVVGASSVYALGHFYNTVTVGSRKHTAKGSGNLLLAALDDSGKHIWSDSYGGNSVEIPGKLQHDSSGNLLLAAAFSNNIDMGGIKINAKGTSDALFSSLTSGGNHRWSSAYGGNSKSYVTGKAALADSKGNHYYLGQYSTLASFPLKSSGTYHLTATGSYTDIFVVGTSP